MEPGADFAKFGMTTGGILRAEKEIPVWKVVACADGSFAVAACAIPPGAAYIVECDGALRPDARSYCSTALLVEVCGHWDEKGEVTRFVAEPPAEYYTAVGLPGRVVYRPGELTTDPVGLWVYAQPWQTYWPHFEKIRPVRKVLDATGANRGVLQYDGASSGLI
jgi:hypothetical protein